MFESCTMNVLVSNFCSISNLWKYCVIGIYSIVVSFAHSAIDAAGAAV